MNAMTKILSFNFSGLIIPLVLCLLMQSVNAQGVRIKIVEGITVTGNNRILDTPAWDFGTILGVSINTFGISTLGVHNANGDEPVPLTADTQGSAILATYVDPVLFERFGLDRESFNRSLVNVPLHKVKTLVAGNNITRNSLPGIFESNPFSKSIAAPNDVITLSDWMQARGRAIIRCNSQGQGTVLLLMEKLVPNRLYTAWGSYVDADMDGVFGDHLGGAPNVFIADNKGRAKHKRFLNYCPLDFIEEANAQTIWLSILFHSDHMVYGGIDTPQLAGFLPGTVAHTHILFPLLGEEVP